ncbi:hypothetical protein C8R47DRAFT_1165433 [Mycena vitilis]|nr:hypothetical protein C8R47DRAFT_1165433 [Mycena vitilis]
MLRVGPEKCFAAEGPMPLLLRSLDIWALILPATFPAMPQLRTLTLRTQKYCFTHPPALLPWSQLTSLTLIGSLPHECTPILLQTPNLVYCELALRYPDTLDLPRAKIPLHHLETLVLVMPNVYGDFPLRYLLWLVAPALRRLQCPELDSQGDLTAILNSFISEAGCTIQELHITGECICETPDDAYRAVFPAIPSISFNPRLRGRDGGRREERRANLADFQV